MDKEERDRSESGMATVDPFYRKRRSNNAAWRTNYGGVFPPPAEASTIRRSAWEEGQIATPRIFFPKHDSPAQTAVLRKTMEWRHSEDPVFDLRKKFYDTGKKWAAAKKELSAVEAAENDFRLQEVVRVPDAFRASSIPSPHKGERLALSMRKELLTKTLAGEAAGVEELRTKLKQSRDKAAVSQQVATPEFENRRNSSHEANPQPPASPYTEGPQSDGSYLLPNGLRARMDFGSDTPSRVEKIQQKPEPKPDTSDALAAGLSGSTDIRFGSVPIQKPAPPQSKSPEEVVEKQKVQQIVLPYALGLGRELGEAQRQEHHRMLTQIVEDRRRTIETKKAANRNLDPFSDEFRANDISRWTEERRLSELEKTLRVLEEHVASEYPGTSLSDALYQKYHPQNWTREKQERADQRAREIHRFQESLRESGEAPNMVETFLAQTAGNVKHTAAGMWEFLGGDAAGLRQSADDNQIFAETRKGVSGTILRGAGDFVGAMAGSPNGKVGWVLGTVRGLANGYSQALAATGDREEARRAVIKEAPWMAVYMVTGQMGAKAGRLLLPKDPRPLLQTISAFAATEVGSISTGAVKAIVEGRQYGLQQLTADTLFAVYHAAGTYKGVVNAADRETAKRELLNRGYSEDQLATAFDAGVNTPAAMVLPKAKPAVRGTSQSAPRSNAVSANPAQLATLAGSYAQLIMSNKRWTWKRDMPGGSKLTYKQRKAIKVAALQMGLIPKVNYKPGTRYADFQAAGVVLKTLSLPPRLWKSSDRAQFKWLDSQIPGGRPKGTTWHHSEISGQMELVPFGMHNIINHIGGRSPGHWAHAPR